MSNQELVSGDIDELTRQIERHRETGWENLDPEMRAFGAAFLSTPTPRGAAQEAGIDPSKGTKLFKNPICRAFISDLQERVERTSVTNTAYVDAMLAHVIPIFLGEEEAPLVVPGVGPMAGKKLHGPELMRALDMVAKHNGYYNADLSQNSFLQMMEAMQEMGRKHIAKADPVDPRQFRVIEGGEPDE